MVIEYSLIISKYKRLLFYSIMYTVAIPNRCMKMVIYVLILLKQFPDSLCSFSLVGIGFKKLSLFCISLPSSGYEVLNAQR
jgi:hypothetical protein